ncbi:cytochrome P450 [Nocardia sp. NPDC052566]|uniref:cytochrome P450 n=1 Tax=Nocardia sp. NPDC052566 TaxID=3364330 RepID=UPI0037C963BD
MNRTHPGDHSHTRLTETPGADTGVFLSLLDPASRADPYPIYQRLRELGPLRIGALPLVVLSGYRDCEAMMRHPAASVDRTLTELAVSQFPKPEWGGLGRKPSFLFLDPPDHTRLRRLVAKAFTPKVVAGLAPTITALVDELLDRTAAAKWIDIVSELAYPLPVTVICELLGVPLTDEAQLGRWSSLVTRGLDPTLQTLSAAERTEIDRAGQDLYGYFADLVEHRRAHPASDLLSQLIAAEDAGDQLTRDEVISTCALLLVAGHETTVNLIANAMLALLRNPGQFDALREDPELATGIVEETLRFDPPVQMVPRIAAADLRIGDADIHRGDVVMMFYAAAHRDPAVFTDPDRFDPTRETRHLAFGLGAHFCLGAPLARLETRIALTRFALRVRSPRLAIDPPVYRDHITLRGPAVLPVDFDAITTR